MTDPARRGVTRGYVWAVIVASGIVAVALMVATWGLLALATGVPPIRTPDVSFALVPLIVALLLAMLAWGLWLQGLVLLRGRRALSWGYLVALGGGAYLLWSVAGTIAGLQISDTWLSIYAATLAVIWAVVSVLFWAVLARRVYTNRPRPMWPWEKRDDEGPDWAFGRDDPRGSDGD